MEKIELRTTQGQQSRPILVRDAQGKESRVIKAMQLFLGQNHKFFVTVTVILLRQ